ncbi:epoxide hydrolase N-terminal domain-containing protein [Siccationidurans ginsengisoli]|nr:epoxide hydrolase N-terminal domain-containing protein [Hymenobacter sp. BT559]
MPASRDPSAPVLPFVAHAPDAILRNLKARLAHTRWPAALAGTGWKYGTNREFLQELVAYWARDFDWRRVEAESNAYPNFTTKIEGLRIHFVHVKGQGAAAAHPRLGRLLFGAAPAYSPAHGGRTGFLRRGDSFPGRVWLFGGEPGPGLHLGGSGRVVAPVDAAAGLPALRGPGRGCGGGRQHLACAQVPGQRHRAAPQLYFRLLSTLPAARRRANPGGASLSADRGGLVGPRGCVRGPARHQAPDGHLRAERLARGAVRLDSRKILLLE